MSGHGYQSPAAARQSLRFFHGSEENQPGHICRAPGIAILTMLPLPSDEHVFSCATCWELLFILKLLMNTDEVVIITIAHTSIRLTSSHQIPVLTHVSLVLLWDILVHVVSGAQGTAKPLKLMQMGNQQAGVSAQSRKIKVKTKVFPQDLV